MNDKKSISRIYNKFGNLLILAAIITIFSLLSPVFLTMTNWMNILRQVSMMAIVAVGFTMLLISGGLDLSIGSQIGVMGIVSGLLLTAGVNPILAVFIGVVATSVIGAFNGLIIVKFKVPPMMATIAMLTALRGLAFILCDGLPIYEIPKSIKFVGQGLLWGVIPVPVVIMLIIIALGIILLNKTYIGRYLFAVGSNSEATRLCGINVGQVKILSYTITGFLCGIAGIIMLGRVSSGQPNAADGFELDVLTAVVLGGVSVNGGRGSVSFAMIGVIIIGVLSNGMMLVGLSEYWQKLVKGAVLLIVIIIDSVRIQNSLKSTK